MTPGAFDLKVYRGDSYHWRFTLWEDEARTIPVQVTGTVKAEIRDKPAGTKIVVMPCTITAPNIVDMTLAPADSALVPSPGVWDLQVTYSPTDVRTYVAGKVVTTPDVTDSVAVPAGALR